MSWCGVYVVDPGTWPLWEGKSVQRLATKQCFITEGNHEVLEF